MTGDSETGGETGRRTEGQCRTETVRQRDGQAWTGTQTAPLPGFLPVFLTPSVSASAPVRLCTCPRHFCMSPHLSLSVCRARSRSPYIGVRGDRRAGGETGRRG